MLDQGVAEPDPAGGRDRRVQVALHLFRIGLLRPAEPAGKAPDVGVDDDAARGIERRAENDVRGLAADTREGEERVHRPRNRTAVLLGDGPGGASDRLRLGVEEPGRPDDFLERAARRPRERRGVREAPEDFGRDEVDAGIGALGRENRRNEELEGRGVAQRAAGVPVGVLEAAEGLANRGRRRLPPAAGEVSVDHGAGGYPHADGRGETGVASRGAQGYEKRSVPRRDSARRAAVGWTVALLVVGIGAKRSAAESVTVTFLETSDLHGHVLPWDDVRQRAADMGLARVATRVAAIRKTTPNVLLLDAGDTIEGTAEESLQAHRAAFAALLSREGAPDADPMARAMSVMGYDAMAVGNHEFDFGLDVLRKAQKESSFPWLSANTRRSNDGAPAFPEYVLRTAGGVRIGILGLTTPGIPGWEPQRNRPGLVFEDPVVSAQRLVPLLRGPERCDFVVVLIHSGLDAEEESRVRDGTDSGSRVAALAREVPGIDLILMGHTHRKVPLRKESGVPVIQPGRWGEFLARVDVTFSRRGRRWQAGEPRGELLPSDATIAPDAAVAAVEAPFERAAWRWLDETVAEAEEAFPADKARLEDTALLDLINDAQLKATGADLSMTALLPGGWYEGLPKGRVTVRDLWALYPYENQLVVVEIDGAQLKACLERAAEFYGEAALAGGRLVLTPNPKMIPYDFDALQGAAYRIDPTEPVGRRVKDLGVRGRPVRPEDRFTLAVNTYRAQGGGGYSALRLAKTVKSVPLGIRELLAESLRAAGHLRPLVDHNWLVAPDAVWAPSRPTRTPAGGRSPQ